MGRGRKEDPNLFKPTEKVVEEEGKSFTPTVWGGMEWEDYKGPAGDINTAAHEGIIRTSGERGDEDEQVALEEVREKIDSMKDNG